MSKQYMTIQYNNKTIIIRTNSERAIKSAISKIALADNETCIKATVVGNQIRFVRQFTSQVGKASASKHVGFVTIVENTFEVEQTEVTEVIETPAAEVVAEQVEVKTEQGIVTVDIIAAATVEQVAEQVATEAYAAGADAKFFAKTHAARIANAAGTELTDSVARIITTVAKQTVAKLDDALMA